LTACLKNAKNTKGQSAICEGLEKYKKIQKYKVYFLSFICIVSYFFCSFTKKIRKKYKKNTNAIAQKIPTGSHEKREGPLSIHFLEN
jgi:hypothetical protein